MVMREEWIQKKLGDIANIRKGSLITEKTAVFGSIPVIAGGKKPAYFTNYANRLGKTVTISGSGASAGYVSFHRTSIFASDCSTISENANYCIEFIYFNLLLKQEIIYKFQTGGAQPHVHPNVLRPLTINLPPTLKEQQVIADVLSDTDSLIEALEKLISKKRLVKLGVMQELLRPKEGWIKKQLGDIALFYKGKGLAKSELSEFGLRPCIHYGELFTKYEESIRKILSRTDTNQNVFYSLKNDVLMPTSDVTPNGLAKASCVLEDKIILGGDILIIRVPVNQLQGIFLSYTIRMHKDQIMQLITGTTVYHLYSSDMKRFKFFMPSIKEQEAIIKMLVDLDDEITALKTKLSKIQAIKHGMMDQLLTGKIRLV